MLSVIILLSLLNAWNIELEFDTICVVFFVILPDLEVPLGLNEGNSSLIMVLGIPAEFG